MRPPQLDEKRSGSIGRRSPHLQAKQKRKRKDTYLVGSEMFCILTRGILSAGHLSVPVILRQIKQQVYKGHINALLTGKRGRQWHYLIPRVI